MAAFVWAAGSPPPELRTSSAERPRRPRGVEGPSKMASKMAPGASFAGVALTSALLRRAQQRRSRRSLREPRSVCRLRVLPDGTNEEGEAVKPIDFKLDEDIILYQQDLSPPCVKLRTMFKYYNLPFRAVNGRHPTSDYKKIPVLVINDRQINDSHVIVKTVVPWFTGRPMTEEEMYWEKRITYDTGRKRIYRATDYIGGWQRGIIGLVVPLLKIVVDHSKPKSSELAPKGTTFGQSFRAALGERPFFGGEKPGPVDLSLFGTYVAFDGCSAVARFLQGSDLEDWHQRMMELNLSDVQKIGSDQISVNPSLCCLEVDATYESAVVNASLVLRFHLATLLEYTQRAEAVRQVGDVEASWVAILRGALSQRSRRRSRSFRYHVLDPMPELVAFLEKHPKFKALGIQVDFADSVDADVLFFASSRLLDFSLLLDISIARWPHRVEFWYLLALSPEGQSTTRVHAIRRCVSLAHFDRSIVHQLLKLLNQLFHAREARLLWAAVAGNRSKPWDDRRRSAFSSTWVAQVVHGAVFPGSAWLAEHPEFAFAQQLMEARAQERSLGGRTGAKETVLFGGL
eukprot:g10073.t1